MGHLCTWITKTRLAFIFFSAVILGVFVFNKALVLNSAFKIIKTTHDIDDPMASNISAIEEARFKAWNSEKAASTQVIQSGNIVRIYANNATTRQDMDDPMASYISAIEEARFKALSSEKAASKPVVQSGNIVRIYANNTTNYFEVINNYSCVDTIYLNEPVDYIKRVLVDHYYDYSANDCHLVEAKSISERGQNYYNATCRGNISEAMTNTRSIEHVSRQIGLPGEYNHVTYPKLWTFLHIVQDALVDPNGNVHTTEFTLVPQRCKQHDGSRSNVRMYDEVFTISQYWGEGFYHANLENLPRLVPYIGFLQKFSHIKIHVAKIPLYQDIDGLPDIAARLVTGAVQGHVVYSPAGGPCGKSPVFTTQLLSQNLRRHLPNIPTPRSNIVVIKRSHKRFFSNHDAIVSMLKAEGEAYGLRVVVFPDNPVPDRNTTRLVFNQAMLVVAPHGAGEANLLYSQPGTVLLEGLCYDVTGRSNLCYRNMAQALGMRYHALLYTSSCKKITPHQIIEPVRIILNTLLDL